MPSSPEPPEAADPSPCELVALPAPRALDPAERALLVALAASAGCAELEAQVRAAEVVSRCACGCPSIGLLASGPAVRPEEMVRLGDGGRADVASLRATGRTSAGTEVEAILHVVEGRVEELEIWAGTFGRSPVTELPTPDTLVWDPL